jgi:aerobic carbon-monoxide dehydrogenase large subunit
VVDDFGTVINPLIVEGQVHGGIVQGIGQVLLERTVYDDNGQLLTGSFMDYAMPRAEDVTSFDFSTHPVLCRTNPLGAKGCGEAGNGGAFPVVICAVLDALAPLGIEDIELPASPHRIWQVIQAAKRR